jgi:branched-chain amino acid aminotransferase
MAGAVYVNGRVTNEADAVVPVFDHGFLYGEGVYEVCRTYDGRVRLLARHLARLRASADLIALPVPFDDASLEARIDETLTAAGLRPWHDGLPDAYVRLLLTRGVGELTYDPRGCPTPSLVVIARPHTPPPAHVYEIGVQVAMVDIERNRREALNPQIKSNNLLNNALAMQQALAKGAFEAVMRNHDGRVAECSQSNLFVVTGGVVRTPPVGEGLLPGITRAFVLELCSALGVASEQSVCDDADLLKADEAFLTSTTREIVPVVGVDGHPIGHGHPGPVTRRLLETFRQRVATAV